MTLNRGSDSDDAAFDSPSNSAYYTPASAMSLASQSSRDTEAFAPVAPTPAALSYQSAAPAATRPFTAGSSSSTEASAPTGTAAATGRTSGPLTATGAGSMAEAAGLGSEPVTSTSRGDSKGQEDAYEGAAGRGVAVVSQGSVVGSGSGVGSGVTPGEGEGAAGGLGLGATREGSARSSGSLKALGVAPAVWEGLSAGATQLPGSGSSSRGPLAASGTGTDMTDVTPVTAAGGSGGLISEGAELHAGTPLSAAAAGRGGVNREADSADTEAAAATAAQGVSGAGHGQGVYVGGAHLAAGLEAVPQGTSYEAAAQEAHDLTDAVVAERKSEMASQGEQKSESSSMEQLELPTKAFDNLSRPAGLVQGAPVSPHAHAAQQPGMAGAAGMLAGSSHAVLLGVGGNTVPTSLSTASHINTPDTPRSTGWHCCSELRL
jgi:hypothetical protein